MDDRGPTQPTQLLTLLRQSQRFAEELLSENEQLRLKLVAEEERARAVEGERDALRSRIAEVKTDTGDQLERFHEIEEELNTLANLHVATWQLHSTMDLKQVVAVALEICINLVGADEVVVYLHDEEGRVLVPAAHHGGAVAEELPLDEGPVAAAIVSGRPAVSEGEDPTAVVPLRFEGRTVGAVVIHSLLPQKKTLTDLDHQLFDLLSHHGASAVYGAFLAGVTAQKLTRAAIRTRLD